MAEYKKVVLVGAGSDIGSNLLLLCDPQKNHFSITDVITRPIASDKTFTRYGVMYQLLSRLLLADPRCFDRVEIDEDKNRLAIDGRWISIHFRDVVADDLSDLGPFDGCILATQRDHLRDEKLLSKLGGISRFVVGVAENPDMPAIYAPLIGAPLYLLGKEYQPVTEQARYFALGSCQCVGWTAQLRVVLEAAVLSDAESFELLRAECDIVHPDTASSNMGTQGIGARREDVRDNLRPGKSQLQKSMHRLMNNPALNTVSLRTLTQPPGYQISRFFLKGRIDASHMIQALHRCALKLPGSIALADIPLGSRAYSERRSATSIHTNDLLLHVIPNAFGDNEITEIITQAYVHNTLGYCVSVLDSLSYLLCDENPKCIPA